MTALFDDLYNPTMVEGAFDEAVDVADSPQTGVASTSLEAYAGLRGSLPECEAAVLIGLRRYVAVHHHAPTAYELFQFMASEHSAVDLNSVRPRITSLYHKGTLTRGTKRACRITNKSAYTWAITQESHP